MKPTKLENIALYNSDMNLWKSCEVVNLKTNFRVGQSPWNDTLNRIRFGEQTKEDIELLKSRYTSNFDREHWDEAIHTFFRNEDVQNHNIKMLNKMPGTLVTLGTRHAWNAFRWGLDMPGTFENFEIRIIKTSFTFGPI